MMRIQAQIGTFQLLSWWDALRLPAPVSVVTEPDLEKGRDAPSTVRAGRHQAHPRS